MVLRISRWIPYRILHLHDSAKFLPSSGSALAAAAASLSGGYSARELGWPAASSFTGFHQRSPAHL